MKKIGQFLAVSFCSAIMGLMLMFALTQGSNLIGQASNSPISSFRIVSGWLQALAKDGTSYRFNAANVDGSQNISSPATTQLAIDDTGSSAAVSWTMSDASDGVIRHYFNRFQTSGTGAQTVFTVGIRQYGYAHIGTCDGSTGGSVTYSVRVEWSKNDDTLNNQVTEEVNSSTAATAFSGNNLQITPGNAGQNDWCAYVVVMGRGASPSIDSIIWAL